MSKSLIGSVAIVGCCLLVESAFAQEDRSSPTEMVRLSDGSFIRFERYDGVLLRLKEGRQVARVRLPKAEPIEKRTDVVVSKDETRLLVVHGDSTHLYRPGHLVAILDSMSLRTIAQFPIGDCSFLNLRPLPEYVTLLCHQSQNPGNKRTKKTLAIVTLDLTRSRMTRWFDLGGERRGIWLGPMFLDYYDLTLPLDVKTEGCAAIEASETGSPKTIDASEHPAHVVVLIRKAGLKQNDGPTTGEVWFVSSYITGPPKLAATLARRPTTATLCGDVLYVTQGKDMP